MMKKGLVLLAAFVFTACDQFDLPLNDFIKDATGIARVVGYTIETDHYEMSNGIIAIPPNERTVISVPIRNPQNYNLQIALEGSGVGKASVEVSLDNQAAVVTIDNPVRLEEFNLTLAVSGNGRPMSADQLPRMQARYLNADLASLSVTSPQNALLDPGFNPDITEYTVTLQPGIMSITLSAVLPGNVESSYSINGGSNSAISLVLGANTITIAVTADCGRIKNYYLAVFTNQQPNHDFPVTIPPFDDNPPDVTGITLSRSGSGGNLAERTLTVSNADMYDDGSIEWWFGVTRLGTGPTLELDVSNNVILTPYNILGTQTITIEASISDALYSVDVVFEVVE